MVGRDELEAALRAQAGADVPGPDRSFADELERRLTTGSVGNVVPLARRARRVGATAVVTATLVFAGAAAAAGVVVTRPFDDEPAPTGTTVPVTVTAPATTSTSPVESTPTTSPASVAPPTQPAPSVPSTSAAPVTDPPTTSRSTQPPPTDAPTTTEVRTPATIRLTCSPDAGTVRCTWAGTPPGTASFAVLRSQAGTGPGRVYSVDASVTTWLDPIATTGTTVGYVVHAMDAAGNSIGHSTFVSVACC